MFSLPLDRRDPLSLGSILPIRIDLVLCSLPAKQALDVLHDEFERARRVVLRVIGGAVWGDDKIRRGPKG